MRNTKCKSGFTIVELLMALIVTSIVLAAVATLAYALGSLDDASDDTAYKQAHLRYATLRISELLRNCKLVFSEPSNGLGIWRADDSNDGLINADEIVYLSKGAGSDRLQFIEFSSESNPAFDVLGGIITALLAPAFDQQYTVLIPQCSNVQFVTDSSPPWTKSVSISFDMEENGVTRHYQINTALRSWAGNLLRSAGDRVVSDDD